MTNQTQSDRQGGDGLREKLVAFTDFLNEPPQYEERRMVRDYRHEAYAKWSSLCADIVKLIDTRATREAAEGAGVSDEDWNRALDCAMSCLRPEFTKASDISRAEMDNAMQHAFGMLSLRKAAPPKPAPDTMWEALAARIENCKGLQLYEEAATDRGYTTDTLSEEQRAEIVAALRSAAPVPPADGASGPLVQINDLRQWQYDLSVDGPTRRICGRAADELVRLYKIINASALPSGTVAAEPVARDTNMFSRLADEPLAVIPEGYSAPLDIRTAAEIEFDRKAAKAATPPVRGDRERLLRVNRLLNKVAGLIDDEDTCDPLDDAIKWANEALAIMSTLSVPVQPGAGEREADKDRLIAMMALAIQTAHGALQNTNNSPDALAAGLSSPTPEQTAACERAMDGLEAQADIWADEVNLVLIIKNIGAASRGLNDRMPVDVREGFINRQEANIDALVRQAYLEGFDRGGESRRAYDAAKVKEANDERDELQELLDLEWKADQRAIKRWQEAHPGNDLVWPDRANMVVWLMEQHAVLTAQSEKR